MNPKHHPLHTDVRAFLFVRKPHPKNLYKIVHMRMKCTSWLLYFSLVLCYTYTMRNWSTDTKELRKDPEQYAVWRLEQLVNFGLGEEKIRESSLRKHWKQLHIDPRKKRYLETLLWPGRS